MTSPAFTLAPRGAAFPAPVREPKPAGPLASAPIGKSKRDYTASGSYEIVRAMTADGQWLFEMAEDGTWSVGHVPTETVVKTGPRTLRACRVYVGSGKAAAELKRIQDKENGNG